MDSPLEDSIYGAYHNVGWWLAGSLASRLSRLFIRFGQDLSSWGVRKIYKLLISIRFRSGATTPVLVRIHHLTETCGSILEHSANVFWTNGLDQALVVSLAPCEIRIWRVGAVASRSCGCDSSLVDEERKVQSSLQHEQAQMANCHRTEPATDSIRARLPPPQSPAVATSGTM